MSETTNQPMRASTSSTVHQTAQERSDRMPPTVRHAAPAFHSRRPDSADVRLARRWGCKPKTAKQIRLGLGRRLADVIEVHHEMGDSDRLAQAVAPVEAALAATHTVDARTAVLRSAGEDAAEDALAATFLADPCRATARPLYLAKSAESRAHDAAAHALRRDYDL